MKCSHSGQFKGLKSIGWPKFHKLVRPTKNVIGTPATALEETSNNLWLQTGIILLHKRAHRHIVMPLELGVPKPEGDGGAEGVDEHE